MTDVRTSVLGNAAASLSTLAGVDAIYLSGSLAENTADAYSDIDLRVVVANAAYEAVRAQREHLPTTWGPFLFHETVAQSHTVSYYQSLTKADVFYYSASAMVPSAWLNVGTRILLDRTGQLSALIGASTALRFTAAPHEVVGHLQKAMAGFVEGAKRVRRGEAIYATYLRAAGLHQLLLADDLLAGRAPLGSSKRERVAPDDVAASCLDISAWAAQFHEVLARAEADGHCDLVTAARLRIAADELLELATAR